MNRQPRTLTPALLRALMAKYGIPHLNDLHQRSGVSRSQLRRFELTGRGLGLKTRTKLAGVFLMDRDVFASDILAA